MNFYRQAIAEDFKLKEVSFSVMPEEIRNAIRDKKQVAPEIIGAYRYATGISLAESKDICERYLAFVKAYEDFKRGIVVYTEY